MTLLFGGVFLLVFGSVGAIAVAQIMASGSNIRAKKHPEQSRPRHWWQRWEVWCSLTRDERVVGGKEVGWYPFRWMARMAASELEHDPELLIASMDSLTRGAMIWTEFEVRRLPPKRVVR